MRKYGKDLDALRRNLDGKTVYLIPYCHSDIAWLHTRRWHVSRYTLALDEALDMLDADPEFCYFVDTWTEMLRPYLENRPENRERIARHLASGRFAICGGHWGNLRMTQVGDETIVRNIALGRRRVREQFPDYEPCIYANLDVGIGHSQVPQIMRLGGFEWYIAWRPSPALDAQGVPRAFIWQGASGDTITVSRTCYSGLNDPPERPWGEDWDDTLRRVGADLEVCAEQQGISAIPQFVGMDDTRPLRTCGGDLPCRADELLRAWNERGPCKMRFGTPEHVLRDLAAGPLPTVRGVLDEAEVCYNLHWLGHRSLAWWRENTDRALVEAEIWSSIASLCAAEPPPSLTDAWETLLDVCPHAVQYLLEEDESPRYRALLDAHACAEGARDAALARLLPVALPLDATHLAFISAESSPTRRVVRALVPCFDRTERGFALFDEAGRPLDAQITEVFLAPDELEVELVLDLPPCGARFCRIERCAEPSALPEVAPLALDSTVEHAQLALNFAGGHLLSITNAASGVEWDAGDSRSFLLPSVQRYGDGTWLPDWLDADPLPLEVTSLQLADSGPVRTRVTRTMECGLCRFRQHLDIYGELGEVRATTEMLLREEDVFVGLTVPVPLGAKLAVDIPFGVEPRDPSRVPYGAQDEMRYHNIERRLPGYFWGRSWVDVRGEGSGFALVGEDADRFYWLAPSGRWLAHFSQRVIHQPEGGWEARTTVGQGVGRHVYHHVLVLHDGRMPMAELVRRASAHRRPALCRAVRIEGEAQPVSWLSVRPETVQLSALYREGDAVVLRLYNPTDEPVEAQVDLPFEPKSAELVDFHLQPMSGDVKVPASTLHFPLHPHQIATVRVAASLNGSEARR